jgi:hypothetical protein
MTVASAGVASAAAPPTLGTPGPVYTTTYVVSLPTTGGVASPATAEDDCTITSSIQLFHNKYGVSALTSSGSATCTEPTDISLNALSQWCPPTASCPQIGGSNWTTEQDTGTTTCLAATTCQTAIGFVSTPDWGYWRTNTEYSLVSPAGASASGNVYSTVEYVEPYG